LIPRRILEIVSLLFIFYFMINRIYKSLLKEQLGIFPVVAVVGPRQVGKSTLVTGDQIGAGRRYVTLDELAARGLAERDPGSLLEGDGPVTIDEVQLAPGLLREIKRRVDRDRIPGRYLVTGSADLNHCAELSSVLARRVGILRLPPITQTELSGGTGWRGWLKAETVGELDEAFEGHRYAPFDWKRLTTGGFPLSILARTGRERNLWMQAFQTTYLERDLRRLSDVGNLVDFARLMERSASATGTVLNQAQLARDVGMSPATAGRHLSLLEASLLISRIPPYFANIGKRMVKSPKFIWQDTGLAAHLLGMTDAESIRKDPTMAGRLFETFVLTEIQALLPLVDPAARLFHVRTHDQLEVDGLVQLGRRFLPIEIKAGVSPSADQARAINRWIDLNPDHGPGVVLHAGTEYFRLSRNVRALPVTALFGGDPKPIIESNLTF
jgi:predicted AAA+ superfamily ATPase